MDNKAFVVMQIGGKDSPERKRADEVFNFIIAPALKQRGIAATRADLDPTPGPITAKMLGDLVSSRLVIVDLTGRNPNVYYELGIAHSFARPMIAIADSVANLPFDAKDERVIEIGPYADTGLTYAQGESAKSQLAASLDVVLVENYVPPTPLREVAGSQSLDALAPENPLASEIGQIKETLDEVRVLIQRPRTVTRMPPSAVRELAQLRSLVRDAVVEKRRLGVRDLVDLVHDDSSPGQDRWVEDVLREMNDDRPPARGGLFQTKAERVMLEQEASRGTPSWAGSRSSNGQDSV